MKIFNKGGRTFLFHGIKIEPDKFTAIPDQHAEAAERLLKDYPNELLSGDEAAADVKAAIANSAAKDKEIATLKGQVDKLQKLLLASTGPDELKERAEKAEAALASANEKVATLERQLNAALQANAAQETAPTSDAETVAAPKKRNAPRGQ